MAKLSTDGQTLTITKDEKQRVDTLGSAVHTMHYTDGKSREHCNAEYSAGLYDISATRYTRS